VKLTGAILYNADKRFPKLPRIYVLLDRVSSSFILSYYTIGFSNMFLEGENLV